MDDADPLGGTDAYEILGVDETDSLDAIQSRTDALVTRYQERARQAKVDGDNDTFKESMEALDAVDDAWAWIEANHDAEGGDSGTPTADPVDGDDPYGILGVDETDSLDAIETRANRLIGRYQERARQAKVDGDNDAFKESMEALDAVDDAWAWIEANHDAD
ncbi:MAG: hypothetical protein ABEJ73_02745 [Haloplanus sp.]